MISMTKKLGSVNYIPEMHQFSEFETQSVINVKNQAGVVQYHVIKLGDVNILDCIQLCNLEENRKDSN